MGSNSTPARADTPPPLPTLTLTEAGVGVSWPEGAHEHETYAAPAGTTELAPTAEPRLDDEQTLIPWGTPNALRVVRIDSTETDSSSVALMQLNTRESPPRTNADHNVPAVQTVESDQGVSLGWWGPQTRNLSWNVFRDGSLISTTTDPHFIDDSAPPAKEHVYEIIADDPEAEEDEPSSYSYRVSVYAEDREQFSLPVASGERSGDSKVPRRADVATQRARQEASLEWRSFIPFQYVTKPGECLNKEPNGAYFDGNNRHFSSSTQSGYKSSKLSGRLNYSWDGDAYSSDFSSYVNSTHLYDAEKNVIQTGQARDNSTSQGGPSTPGRAYHGVHLSAGNPLCPLASKLGAIDVHLSIESTSDGTLTVQGKHSKAPSHELLVHSGNIDQCAYRFASKSFLQLRLPAPNAAMSVRFNPSKGTSCPNQGSAITDHWGKAKDSVGRTLERNESCGLKDGGCFTVFSDGSIYWSPATGPHYIKGKIRDKWGALGWEKGRLGYPTTDEICGLADDGCVSRFQGGNVYYHPASGTHAAWGAIFKKYESAGWERGLGYPTSDEICGLRDGGCLQRFQKGHIYFRPEVGTHLIKGMIRNRWGQMGWENSRFGYPRTDEFCGLRDGGCGQHFQYRNGSIYWSPKTGAQPIEGKIKSHWASMGWERSQLGYPTTGEYKKDGVTFQDFQGGWLAWNGTSVYGEPWSKPKTSGGQPSFGDASPEEVNQVKSARAS